MPGSFVSNFHDGARSEYIAQVVLSAWGASVAVPRQEDHGIDFLCTLGERVGQLTWARSPYTVQVKSNDNAWEFEDRESIRWLIEHPLPLFLSIVDKQTGRFRLYQTMPRFYVGTRSGWPERMRLVPGDGTAGRVPQWTGQDNFNLSAPILDVSWTDVLDEEKMSNARRVMEFWLSWEYDNLHRLRSGILSFEFPDYYSTNATGFRGTTIQSQTPATEDQLGAASEHLKGCLEWFIEQSAARKNHATVLRMLILYRKLFPDANPPSSWRVLLEDINALRPSQSDDSYIFRAVDEVGRIVDAAIGENPS